MECSGGYNEKLFKFPIIFDVLDVGSLKPRVLKIKPTKTKFEAGLFRNRIVVKFKDGASVRLSEPAKRSGASTDPSLTSSAQTKPILRFDSGKLSTKDRSLLKKRNLTVQKVSNDLTKVNQILKRPSIQRYDRLFSRSDVELAKDRKIVEEKVNFEAADFSNYYSIKVDDENDTLNVLDQLNALDSVEIAYLAPIPEDADVAPPTGSFTATQGYLNAAPRGIDAKYAWTQNGGKGRGIKIIDIERGWNLNHEDLPNRFFQNGIIKGGSSRQHGTAVLGVVVAKKDGAGVDGIVPKARYGVVSAVRQRQFLFIRWEDYSVAEAINVAASRLNKGDVMIIEQHARGPGSNSGCTCNCDQYRYIAMEYWSAEYDAIRAATAKGIVVVEAAGNGGQNLDHSRYNNRFNRSVRDSGAILVGGGSSSRRSPMCWTNYGSRVDLQGWGQNVMTTGYGNKSRFRINGSDDDQWYTDGFSGTSSASPVVAGAVAAIQGIRKARGYEPMKPKRLRKLLVDTGTAQGASSRNIGPLPNLRAAINKIPNRDCVNFNHNSVQAKRVQGRWKVVDGNHWIMDFGNERSEARKAKNIIKHYDLTKMCFIGRPNPSLTYFLKGNSAPSGSMTGEDCIRFNPNTLNVTRRNGNWLMVSGTSSIRSFGNKRNEALAAVKEIKAIGANRTCYVGRPKPSMTYFRK